jgi:hypothetical protein
MQHRFLILILVLISFSLTVPAFAQLVPLAFRPVAAEYSSSLDRIIMISANPDQLHVYDPVALTDTTVDLSKPPLFLSVSPDGFHAAVGHDSLISYVNLSSAAVEKTYPTALAYPQVVLGTSWIYVLTVSNSFSINIQTSETIAANFVYPPGGARLHPTMSAIYGAIGFSPSDIGKIEISSGPMTTMTDSAYHGDFNVDAPICYSPDGNRVYTGYGIVFQASTNPSIDMHYTGSLPGVSHIEGIAESSALKTIAVTTWSYNSSYERRGDNSFLIYESDHMNPIGKYKLPDFQVGENSFAAAGKWIFFNAASTALLVLEQADSSSGLSQDFRLQIISLTPPTSCGAAFASTTAQAVAQGEIGSVNIMASAECRYSASSQAPWIEIVSGGNGSGDGVLRYIVRANDGPARGGTISIGDSVLTISQDASRSETMLTRLPYNVVGAAFDKPLGKLILISSGPNELHVVDPLTHSDQRVALALAPLCISVRPDGQYAAIGHDGWVSYVNLQTVAVEQVFKVLANVNQIVLAGNGYAYLLSPNQSDYADFFSLNIATGINSEASSVYGGRVLRLHANGNYLYVGGEYFTKWAIGGGVAVYVSGSSVNDTCLNIWLTEDGMRLFNGCGRVYRTSSVPAEDYQRNGSLSNLSRIFWADEASIPGVTAVLGMAMWSSPGADKLRIYEDAYLQPVKAISLRPFSVKGASYTGYGQYVFWDAAETKAVVIEKADDAAGLLSSYGVAVMTPLSDPRGSDFDADGKADFTVWRPDTGMWYTSFGGDPTSYVGNQWGARNDLVVAGDYDGDGKSDIAVFRPDNGTWYILTSGTPGSYQAIRWGLSDDIPVPGDYDGDGKTDIAVFRASTGMWFILTSGTPGSYRSVQWGMSGDVPVVADYDGDGKADIAVLRPSSGMWYILTSGTTGSYRSIAWGLSDDIPVPGDYDGDGMADVAVFRASTGMWFILTSGTPGGYRSVPWGMSGDVPVAADYDGDGKTDIAVWRPGEGIWYVLTSGSSGTYTSRQWGLSTDVPVTPLTRILGVIH